MPDPTRLNTLLAIVALILVLACTASNPEDNPLAIKEDVLLEGYKACLSAGGTEGYCQCLIDRHRENIPEAWFVGTEEPKAEWADRASAACNPIRATPTPTHVPFSVEEWDPYSPIPEGLSYEDSSAAYEKWGVEYERLTLPWRQASDRVVMAWNNANPNALLPACQHWNDVQRQIWTPALTRLAEAVNYPSQPLRMDCRNMALSIFVPGADMHDFIFDAP